MKGVVLDETLGGKRRVFPEPHGKRNPKGPRFSNYTRFHRLVNTLAKNFSKIFFKWAEKFLDFLRMEYYNVPMPLCSLKFF